MVTNFEKREIVLQLNKKISKIGFYLHKFELDENKTSSNQSFINLKNCIFLLFSEYDKKIPFSISWVISWRTFCIIWVTMFQLEDVKKCFSNQRFVAKFSNLRNWELRFIFREDSSPCISMQAFLYKRCTIFQNSPRKVNNMQWVLLIGNHFKIIRCLICNLNENWPEIDFPCAVPAMRLSFYLLRHSLISLKQSFGPTISRFAINEWNTFTFTSIPTLTAVW